MHNVQHNVINSDQLMQNNYSYFSKQHDDNSYIVINLISASSTLIARQAVAPKPKCYENNTNKQIVFIAV